MSSKNENIFLNRTFLIFLAKFILIFLVCYYGTLAQIGLAAEEGHYSPFVDKYLDYVHWIRISLLKGTEFVLNISGIETYLASEFNIRQVNGRGIIVGYECVGYGIMSFWTAYIIASPGSVRKKIIWWLGAILGFWVLNVARMVLLFIATNKGWPMPLGWDHHTWFNITTYILIFIMIYYFSKTTPESKTTPVKFSEDNTNRIS